MLMLLLAAPLVTELLLDAARRIRAVWVVAALAMALAAPLVSAAQNNEPGGPGNPDQPGTPALVVPSAFTPNTDGQNDRWTLQLPDSLQAPQVVVYNRYGRTVFQAQGQTMAWDGRAHNQGDHLPMGVYPFVLRARLSDGTPYLRTGTVTLIR